MSYNYTKTKLACYSGFVVQAIINNFLPILFVILQDSYKLSYEALGRIVLFNFCTQIVADLLTPKITDIFGYKGCAVLSQLTAALGLILLSFLPGICPSPYVGIVISVMVYAMGSGMMEVILSPIMELLPTKNKGANMAFTHSFYCWGQAFTVILTTIFVKLIGDADWNLIPIIWAVIPLVNTVAFTRVKVVEPPKEQRGGSLKGVFKERTFYCFVIFMVCAGASEIAMAEWASLFAQQGLNVSKVTGDLLGPCAFAICQGTGRVVLGAFSGKYSTRKVLIINNILCAVCYIMVGVCDIKALSLVACALCGFTVSLSWPGTYSLAAAKYKNGGTKMFSIFAFCGDIGCSLGPWLLGLVADYFGLNTGFVVSSAFPLLMVIAAFVVKEKDCKVN